jgi:hypothetical protein
MSGHCAAIPMARSSPFSATGLMKTTACGRCDAVSRGVDGRRDHGRLEAEGVAVDARGETRIRDEGRAPTLAGSPPSSFISTLRK